MLAEIEFSGAELLQRDEAVDHVNIRDYWEKRLSAAQKRFTRACETLTRVRKLSRKTPALQFNVATQGGQQVNVFQPQKTQSLTQLLR